MKSLRVSIFNAKTKQKIVMQHQEERYTEIEYIAILSFDVEDQQ